MARGGIKPRLAVPLSRRRGSPWRRGGPWRRPWSLRFPQAVWPLARVRVDGDSMAPALLPGDRLVVLRTRRLRPGDIAVADDPRDPSRPLVKRVAEVRDGEVVLRGDNGGRSTDSRTFGPVPRELVRGRAVYRYAPPERAGRLAKG